MRIGPTPYRLTTATSLPSVYLENMQVPDDALIPMPPPDSDSVRRLLAALGEWGAAEVEGASEPVLDELEDRAMSAYRDIASVA